MNEKDLAALFMAMYGNDPPPDMKTRGNAIRRLVFSPDGLTLIKSFSGCLQGRVNTFSSERAAWLEGRRSILLDMIGMIVKEEDD